MSELERETDAVEAALQNMVQNLLRCISGGSAGDWHSIMSDIHKCAVANQSLGEKNKRGLLVENVQRALAWEDDEYRNFDELTPAQRDHRAASDHLQSAYGRAMRVVAYRISGVIKAQESRAENDFLDYMRERDAALKRYRQRYA